MPPSDQEPRYRLVDGNGNVIGSLFQNANGDVEIADQNDTSYVFTTSPSSGTDVARFQDLTDVSDGGTTVVSEVSDINFASNVSVTDDTDGTVTIDATDTNTDTRTDVSDDGTTVVSEVSDINFSDLLAVTDDTDGTVTVDVSDPEYVVEYPDQITNTLLDGGESVEISVQVADQETLEVYRWGAYQVTDGTAPTGLSVELKDGADTVQASANTTNSQSTTTPVASYQNTSGTESIFKLAIANDTGSTIASPGVGGQFGWLIA